MTTSLHRRDFLKLGGLALAGAAFGPVFPRPEQQPQGLLGRIASKEIDLRSRPNDEASIIGKRYRDQLVHIYEELIPDDAPAFYNRLWYRVWGGYLHSAHIQIVNIRLNESLERVSPGGQLAEVTVPYTVAYQNRPQTGWQPWRGSRLYYGSTHWITGLTPGPDGQPWYQITNELSSSEIYFVPAIHLRLIPPEEVAPISPHIPPEKKRIHVSLEQQTLYAYEFDQEVYKTRISSGIPNSRIPDGELPTATPQGEFRIYSKMPSKHMGSVAGGPEVEERSGFSLPGVPWTMFFKFPGGYALHGTYWHNNFGLQMSHGCVNMRNEDALWLFRWSTPVFDLAKVEAEADWEVPGNGTKVLID